MNKNLRILLKKIKNHVEMIICNSDDMNVLRECNLIMNDLEKLCQILENKEDVS